MSASTRKAVLIASRAWLAPTPRDRDYMASVDKGILDSKTRTLQIGPVDYIYEASKYKIYLHQSRYHTIRRY